MALLRWPRLRWLLLPVCATLILLLWRGRSQQLQQWAGQLLNTGTITSLAGRQEVWSRAIYMIQDFSYTGIGLGTFDLVQPLLYPFFLSAGLAHHAHNLFLQVAVDLGLPGLIAYLALLLGSFYSTWSVWQQAHAPSRQRFAAAQQPAAINHQPPAPCSPVRAASPAQAGTNGPSGRDGLLLATSLGLLGSQTVLVLHGLLDAAAWGNKLAFIPWFILGLAVASQRVEGYL
jgi:putative inorganic carbon (HCO3(-)) transporter